MKEEITQFLQDLQLEIIHGFEGIEGGERFEMTPWNFSKGQGGGKRMVLRGKVFEKAAVNFSAVSADSFPMEDGSGPFFATGVSLITHMANPHMPTVHFNIRYLETNDTHWFGGGYDLTPMGISYPEDTTHFHAVAKNCLDPFGAHLYPQFSAEAKEYYFLPHRNKERGVGGIFFDHYNTGDMVKDLSMWKQVGKTFLDAILPIYERRRHTPFTPEEKQMQLKLRGHYAEFNLIYDRGTKFGLRLGDNTEGILCSMPPVANW